MAQSTLKVLQVSSIAPAGETSPITLPFTYFDLLWLRLPPVERLFFYPFPNPPSSFFHSILPKLKHSLSLTLQHFLPLCGSITWPSHSPFPLITYHPGNTIPFSFTESNADFTLLSSLSPSPVDQRQHLIPHLTISHDHASLLALQVTLFPNLGFCIGITTHHAALDGKSSTLFLKSWAFFCSHLDDDHNPSPSLSLPPRLTPFFDRSVIKDPLGLCEIYANTWLSYGGARNDRSLQVWESIKTTQGELVKGVFEFTPSQIKKLKQHAESKVGDKKVRLSSFSVACAYLLASAVKVDRPKANRVGFLFSVDCRPRLGVANLENYFGNCVVTQAVVAKREEVLGDDGFIRGLEGISEALNEMEERGVLNGMENWMEKIQSLMEDRLFSVAGSPRFEVYEVDFGWGRPVKVDVTSIDKTGAFSLSESKNHSGGIEVGLALNKEQMEVFATVFAQGLDSL
ncbi:hypothetical protein RJT34_28087 [Clitoria ternatea]|uniref:Putative anthocyanin malonyltransferase n=1 Tax=Clitoria ternatea TaxID=43366 RepID=A4F1S4_CLITE|nr:putative anthocyanin malonyltransferase [Clitoria ternatea]